MRTVPGCLPLPLSSFVGREREASEIRRLLVAASYPSNPDSPSPRLLTLTGTAGVGKTRLALQVATAAQAAFAQGACFVPLADVLDPNRVLPAIGSRLSLKESGNRPMAARLRRFLQHKQLLLVIDNFEQIVTAAPQLEEILAGCPRLVMLVTSREILHLPAEREFRVRPLPLPSLRHLPGVESLARYAGVALFVERAQAANPAFRLTAENAPAVARICHDLEGLPLAIELAAARVKMLSVSQIAARLNDRFTLLVRTGSSAGEQRHRTLRAALDWSYDLLSPQEQALFRHLAVFAGGFTLESAEAVHAQGPSLDPLSQLVDKSLAQVEPGDGTEEETRYSLLETIREYACEKLEGAGEAEAAGQRHMTFFVRLAEEAEPQLKGAAQIAWAARLEREQDNLWAAASWSRSHEADAAGACRLAGAMAWFWRMLRGNPSEWRGWCEEILVARRGLDHSTVRARALLGVGTVALLQGDFQTARALAEESVGLWDELRDQPGLAHALNLLALVQHAHNLNEEAKVLYERSLAIRREIGDGWGMAQTLNNLATLAETRGDLVGAAACYRESLAHARASGDRRLIGLILIGLASVTAKQGDCQAAGKLYAESLATAQEMGDKWLAPQSLDGLAKVIASLAGETPRGVFQVERAVRLWGAADGLREAAGTTIWPGDRAEYDVLLAAARSRLGEAVFGTHWAQGHALTIDEAAAHALREAAAPCDPNLGLETEPGQGPSIRLSARQQIKEQFGGLTPREREVAALIARGKSNRAIAEALVLTERTVTTHVSNILGKLELSSRTQIAAWAIEKGLNLPSSAPSHT